jgi:hypothetical protein
MWLARAAAGRGRWPRARKGGELRAQEKPGVARMLTRGTAGRRKAAGGSAAESGGGGRGARWGAAAREEEGD